MKRSKSHPFISQLCALVTALLLLGSLEGRLVAAPVSAKTAYQDGVQAYQQQRWQVAADAFERAYALSGSAVILFNIGQCYRKLGQTARALEAYRRFVAIAENTGPRVTVVEAQDYIRALQAPARPPTPNPTPTLNPNPPPNPTPNPTPTLNPPPNPTPNPNPTPTLNPNPPSLPPTAVLDAPAPTKKKRSVVRSPWLWTGVGLVVAGVALGVGLGVGLRQGDTAPEPSLGTRKASFP